MGHRLSATHEGLLEAMPEGALLADFERRIVHVNVRATALTEYGGSELVGRPVQTLFPSWSGIDSSEVESPRAKDEPQGQSLKEGRPVVVRRRNGGEFEAMVAVNSVLIGNQPRLLVSFRDLTAQRRLEQELRETRERFHILVAGASDHAIYLLDPEGRVVSWNEGGERIEGYPASEILGRSFSIFFPPRDVEAGKPGRSLEQALSLGRFEDEGWRLRRDGTRFWASTVLTPMYDESGQLLGFSKILRDMTESRRAWDRLEALREIAEAIVEGRGGEVILTMIAREARSMVRTDLAAIVTPGPAPATMTVTVAVGREAKQLRGLVLPIHQSLAGQVFRTATALLTENLEVDPRAYPAEVAPLRLGPAVMVPLAVAGRCFGVLAMFNRDGGRVPTGRDLSVLQVFASHAAVALEYNRIRGELQRLAVIADRERIGRELHDGTIQSLFAVGMNLELAARRIPDPQVHQRLDVSIERIQTVIADLRNYVFGLRPNILLDQILGQALEELARELEMSTGVTTVTEIDLELASRLAQMESDLVQMAREGLSNIGRHAQAMTCRLRLVPEGRDAVLEIEDDGIGFETETDSTSGHGLRNLRQRAATLDAKVEVESKLGVGTRLRVKFPAPAPRAPASAKT